MLVLMYFAIHVWVCVCVNVRVDLWIDFGHTSLGQQKLLLLGNVLLVTKWSHVFLITGRHRTWGPVSSRLASLVWQSLVWVSGAGGTLLLWLAEPEEDGTQNEDHSSGDADDDWPGQAGGHHSGNGIVVWAGVCTWEEDMQSYAKASQKCSRHITNTWRIAQSHRLAASFKIEFCISVEIYCKNKFN